jgi:hypothetical protein
MLREMFLQLLAHHTHKPPETISRSRIRVREYSLKLARYMERRYSPREVRLPTGPPPGEAFRIYLERHVDGNAESHGPMAERMLMSVCGSSRSRWEEAEETARTSINLRDVMWHGVLRAVQAERAANFAAAP